MENNTSLSLDRLFDPRSIAVIGASNIPGKWGFVIPLNIKLGRYKGNLFLVHPKEKRIQGSRAYPSLLDIEQDLDLVVIAIPAAGVPKAMKECAKKGVPNVLVISSNFSEVGEEGARLEREVAAIALDAGINMIGPNTMGMCSPPTSLYAMYSVAYPGPGDISFLSQSGNVGVQILGWATSVGVGIARYVNTGNEATMSSDLLLEYLKQDKMTRVILMYIEGVKNGERFLNIARRVARTKPIIVLKSGGTAEGARAARSHSGSIAGDRRVFEAAAAQAGVIIVRSSEELVEMAKAFSAFPIPKGNHVGIMTQGGGWGVVTADVCSREGLQLPPLSHELTEYINSLLPAFWSHGNPVDMVGTPQRSHHVSILEALAHSEDFDSIITLGTLLTLTASTWGTILLTFSRISRLLKGFSFGIFPFLYSVIVGIRRSLRSQGRGKPSQAGRSGKTGGFNLQEFRLWDDMVFAAKVLKVMAETGKPIIAVGFNPDATHWIYKKTGLVSYGSPEKAAFTISQLSKYGAYQKRARERVEEAPPPIDVPERVSQLLQGKSGALDEHEGKLFLKEFGIPIVEEQVAVSLDNALNIAERIGYPVCLKVVSPQILHKTEAGGVALNISYPDALKKAYEDVLRNSKTYMPGAEIRGVLIQKMITGGTEVIAGITQDPQFGPVVLFGLGGILVEVLKDISMRIAPLLEGDAREMIEEIKGAPLLKGFRGRPPADLDSMVKVLLGLSTLAYSLKDRIQEVDINPLIVSEKGATAVDALVVLR